MLEFFRSEYAVDDDMLPEIVDSTEFFDGCKNLVANKKTYDVALAELVARGEVCYCGFFLFYIKGMMMILLT